MISYQIAVSPIFIGDSGALDDVSSLVIVRVFRVWLLTKIPYRPVQKTHIRDIPVRAKKTDLRDI